MIYEYMSFYSYGALYTKLSNPNLIVKYKKIFFTKNLFTKLMIKYANRKPKPKFHSYHSWVCLFTLEVK